MPKVDQPIDLIAHHHGTPRPEIKCLDQGFITLVDIMPRITYNDEILTADSAVVQAARVSYGDGTKKVSEDRGLIRYLMRHRHTTPLEMIEMKFHCSMPVFVARQWIRHRTANVNEYSARYSVVPDKFYSPENDDVRIQSSLNKQVSEGSVDSDDAKWFIEELDRTSYEAYALYEEALKAGIGREQARMFLPINVYTEWYWKIDLHNLLHFLSLRCDSHAQKEIRVFAEAIKDLVQPICPLVFEAWEDYHPYRQAITLSRLEVEAIRNSNGPDQYGGGQSAIPKLNVNNKREEAEWEEKARNLGFI